jgi:NADPH-dependent ferric siderophore reductase
MTQEQQVRPARPRPVKRAATVSDVELVTPHLLRLTFNGGELAGWTTRGPAEHLRLFFPAPGEQRPVMPERDADGRPLEGQPRPISRVYTPREWRPETNELLIEFAMHDAGEGPGTLWARGAKPGDEVVISGPSGAYNLDPAADWYVIAGDHAGLPAVETVLEALPAGAQTLVYIEVPDASEEIELHSPAAVRTVWLHTGADVPGQGLAAAMRAAGLPQGNGRIFVACEAAAMRDIRRHLLHERKLPRESVHTHGYWQHGEGNHPDHDLGQEIE